MENFQNIEQQVVVCRPKKLKLIIFLFILFIILGMAAGAIYGYYQIYGSVGRSNEAVVFEVEKGMGVKKIAENLEKQKIIRSAFWFKAYIWYKNQSSDLQAGEYSISLNLNVPEVISVISGGKVVLDEKQVTFPEGFNLNQIKERLLEQGFSAADFIDQKKIGDFQVQYKFLSELPPDSGLEGFLFPDTYRFKNDITKEEVIKKFLDNFENKLTPNLREEMFRQNKSIDEILKLASIVQLEAANENEMPMLAGVFLNRLKINMPLQSDATVNYATGKKMRQATIDDTKIDSPYNTYLRIGLPPAPVCNPGLAAIKAVIYPQTSDYLYFLHPMNGSAIFSRTLDEHNINKVKYLK